MPDNNRVFQLIDAARRALDDLEGELGGGGSSRSTARAMVGGAAGERFDRFDQSRAIPPTQTDDPDSIVGGTPTTEFPDCCAVGNDSDYYCTGTLIAPTVVVTAAHCPNLTRVFLKGSDVSQAQSGETIRVKHQFKHDQADLRVLVLEPASTVAPRHIAQDSDTRARQALLVGFGTVDFDGTIGYGMKRKVEVPIISSDCSGPGESRRFRCDPGNELVAGHRGLNRDSCRGDSGGPLYVRGEDGLFHLLGVTSRGVGGPRVCGDGGIYVRVDRYLSWIREKTGVNVPGPTT
jgi:secreted trypsin-like serine protease